MKESMYNIKFNYNGLSCIYNTKTSKLIVSNNYNDLVNNFNNDLEKGGFYVSEDIDEFQEVVKKRQQYLKSEKDYKRYTILPTTKCNANCIFCYENDFPRYDMTDEIVDETINFIKKDCINKKKLRVYWFGGEPLLRKSIIDKISKNLIDFCNANGISYKSSIATNLSLFNKDDIQYAIDNWNLDKIEFAFDGNHNQHNNSKNYKIDSFDAFQHNLEMIDYLLQKRIVVQIRFNINKENFEDALVLIENILVDHHENKNLLLYLGVIFKTPKNNDVTKEELIEMKKIGEYSIKFFEILRKYDHIHGANELPLGYKKNNCYASNSDSIVIGSSGMITKCQMCSDDKEHEIGNIYNGVNKLNENYDKWCNTLFFENCIKCKMYPICLTGCIGQKFIYDDISCSKERFYLEELLKAAIKMLEQDNQLEKNKVLSLKRCNK